MSVPNSLIHGRICSTAPQDVPAEVVALTCDTTGTLIASHYVNPATKIAVIFGTGCNAAYMERVADIPKISSLGIDPTDEIAINCEWVRTLSIVYWHD